MGIEVLFKENIRYIVNISCLSVITFFFTTLTFCCKSNAEPLHKNKLAEAKCLNLRSNDSSYQKAIDKIFALKSVKNGKKK